MSKKEKVGVKDSLPLLILDELAYKSQREHSLQNNVVYKEKWEQFLKCLPESANESVPNYSSDRDFRFEFNNLKYKPAKGRPVPETRLKMTAGPKLDGRGRLPIPGEQLNLFRASTSRCSRLKAIRSKTTQGKLEKCNMSKCKC